MTASLAPRLRHVAEVNPATPEFDRLDDADLVSFVPLERVWPRGLDSSELRAKVDVSVGYTRFRSGDIVVPKITPTFQADRATIAGGLHAGVAAGTTELHIVRCGPQADPRYVRYLLSSRPFLSGGEAEMIGVAGQKRVPDVWLRDFRLPVVIVDAQRRIADYLDAETARIDALIDAKQQMISMAAAKLRSKVDQVFAQLRAPEPALRRFTTSITQGVSSPAGTAPATSTEWGVLKLSAVKWGRFIPGENKVLPAEAQVDESLRPEIGDLLVTRSNTPAYVGDVCAVVERPGRVLLPDLIYRLRLASGLDSGYASYALRTSAVRGRLSAIARGTSGSMVKLRGEDITGVRIPVPDGRLQVEVRILLDEVTNATDDLTDTLDRQIDLLRERRQSLITAAVTGEMEIP